MNWSFLKLFRPSVRTPDVYVNPKREQYIRNPIWQKIQQFKRFIENYRRHIVCFIVVYGIAAGLCLERCYCEWKPLLLCHPLHPFPQGEPFFKKMFCFFSDYRFQAESTGIPKTSVVGIAISRGTAASISFLFPYMLLTVCRNLITLCRETFLNRYIPFDAAIDFHRFMAMTAIVLSGGNGAGR